MFHNVPCNVPKKGLMFHNVPQILTESVHYVFVVKRCIWLYMVQCGYAKTLYIYIYLYNVPKPAKLSDLVGKDLSQIALFHFSISHSKSSSISLKMEHWNIALFSMTYRHTQRNIMEHYSTLQYITLLTTIQHYLQQYLTP